MTSRFASSILSIALISLLTSCMTPNEQGKFMAKAGPAVHTEEVTYTSNGQTYKGFLAIPDGEGPFPGVIVIHEWWGLNDYPKQRAVKFAEQGYAAFALDLYGNGKTTEHPSDAKAFAGKAMADMNGIETKFRAAVNAFHEHPKVDKSKLAAAGYCFGGAVALEMARRNFKGLNMVASYHGGLSPITDNKLTPIKPRILIFNGGADPMVSSEVVAKTRQKLKDIKARYKFVNYKGAKHAFTNPDADSKGEKFNLPLAYNKAADEDSWKQTLAALKVVFGEQK